MAHWDPRAVVRTLLISGYRFGLTARGSRPRLPGLWECNDRPRINLLPASRCAPVSADLLLTWDVPAVDLSCTSRDGTDDAERSKRPVTCALLTTQPMHKGQFHVLLNRRVERGAGTGAQSHEHQDLRGHQADAW